MPLHAATKELLVYLRANPAIRAALRAAPDRTLLYAGSFFRPAWQEIARLKLTSREVATKETLPDVLARIPAPNSGHATLLEFVKRVEAQVPWKPDGFIAWRALSGIFASNASGAVSFYVGSGVTPDSKVFAATEVAVLERNPAIDPVTRDALAYYRRCLETKNPNMDFAFISK